MSLLPKIGSLLPKLGKLIGAIPYSWVTYGAVLALAFTLGLATGNSWATKHALEIQAEANKDWRERIMADHAAKIAAANARIAELTANDQAADDEAVRIVRVEDTSARDAYEAAITQLANEKEQANAVCNARSFAFSPATRELLDRAAGAAPGPGDSDTAAPAPGAASGADEPAAALTPDELANGYAALGRHDRECMARLSAWQEWWRRANP